MSLGDELLREKDDTGLVQLPSGVLERAAREILTVLTSPEKFRSITEHNVAVCKKHFGFDELRAHLQEALQWAATLNS